MSSRRNCLVEIDHILLPDVRKEKETNAGLWFDKYIDEQSRENTLSRREHIEAVSTLPISTAYKAYYARWEKILQERGAKVRHAVVKGRMIVGLGSESVLETSISLHRTYGVPYIPGSALKGSAANYAHHRLGENWQKGSSAFKVIFGDTDDAGYITFFDALYIPDAGNESKKALYPDVITVHHQKYYQSGSEAPTDRDSPNPVSLLSATGTYLIALAAPELRRADEWINRTFSILEKALETLGVGAKTSSGYGRMKLLPPPVDPDLKKAESYKREIESIKDSNVASQIHGYYQKWQQITSDEGRIIVARAIIEKVRQAGREKATAEKAWYKELLAFLSR